MTTDATDPGVDGLVHLMDDDALLARLADDLDSAFEALVRAHQDRLYTIALRMLGNASDAEEVAQDAFLRAYRALAGYEPARIRELRLRGWLATIVIRRCRSRAVRRHLATTPLGPELADTGGAAIAETTAAQSPPSQSPVQHALRRESAEAWVARIAALPERYRAAIVLRHVDGLSYPEMSEVLGRPEGTVKAQVHRGLALLRHAIEASEREESIA
jgi:RNA polymerase sigma-70 factor (ECF subfamily)